MSRFCLPGLHVLFSSYAGDAVATVASWFRRGMLGLGLLALSGCAVTLVSAFDKQAVERTTETAKLVFDYYQLLLNKPAAERAGLANGELRAKSSDVDSRLRVHLLLEQARDLNKPGISIARELLDNWNEFSASHLRASSDPTVLSDATLRTERGVLERQFGAALKAEEVKKLATSGS